RLACLAGNRQARTPVYQDRLGSLSSVMTIYFVAGEVSADNHGAALMRSLRTLNGKVQFVGRGGPQMREVAGDQFKNWIGEAAVLGLWEVLRKYGYFRGQFHETLREIRQGRPDRSEEHTSELQSPCNLVCR